MKVLAMLMGLFLMASAAFAVPVIDGVSEAQEQEIMEASKDLIIIYDKDWNFDRIIDLYEGDLIA